METLKLIPQVFFDLIARVIPGSVGLVSYLILCKNNWQSIITSVFGQSFAQESTTLSFLIFLGAGFVVGELLSPAAKMVQRINEIKIFSSNKKNKYSKSLPSQDKPEEKFSEKKLRYDRLRLLKPEVGALCAKIRAEFTMHNGLSVVFAMNSIYYPFSQLAFNWFILAFLSVLTFLTAYRGRTTNQTFNETVEKFTRLLDEKKMINSPIE